MSTTLWWKVPPVEPEADGGLGPEAKRVVAQAVGMEDWGIREPVTIDQGSAAYHFLRGAVAGSSGGSDVSMLADLVVAIERNGKMIVFIE